MSGYEVVTAACSVYLKTGAVSLLYKGAVLPGKDELADGEVKRLLEGGFVVKGEAPAEAPEPEGMKAGDDPGGFSVAQVQAFLASADDGEKARVLEAEAAGKNRASLVGSV